MCIYLIGKQGKFIYSRESALMVKFRNETNIKYGFQDVALVFVDHQRQKKKVRHLLKGSCAPHRTPGF